MECTECRDELSARLDGEEDPAQVSAVDAHLLSCPECARWQTAATNLTRRLRVRAEVDVPDLTGAVLAAAPPRPARAWPRAALLVVAVLQWGVVMAQVLGALSHGGHGGSGHLFNEGVAWNVAVGVALLMVCVRPADARGLLTPLTTFVGVLALYTAVDMVNSTVTAPRVLSHLPLVAGLVLLYLIKRQAGGDSDPARQTGGAGAEITETDHPDPAVGRPEGGVRPLRPSAREAA